MPQETTVRIELARNRSNISKLVRETGLSRDTINAVLDGCYDKSNVSSLRKIEQALPTVRLVVRFELVSEN